MSKPIAVASALYRREFGTASVGSWLLVAFLCLSLPSSLVAHPSHTHGPVTEGLAANLSDCLIISTRLMEVADVALHQFQEGFTCTLEHNPTENPKNEEKIMKACMGGKSMSGFCPSGENDAVDQTLCMDAIYKILKHYVVEIRDFDSPDLYEAISFMMQALKINHKLTEQQPPSPLHSLNKTFQMQMKQCKIFLILQQLSQTINRILRYQKSLEM